MAGGSDHRHALPALTLFNLGTALVLGRLIFFVIALFGVLELHVVICFEERFLVRIYGDAYREYGLRVGRYLTWPAKGKKNAAHL